MSDPSFLRPVHQGDIGERTRLRVDGVLDLDAVDTAIANVELNGETEQLDVELIDRTERTIDVVYGAADGWLAGRPTVGWWKLQVEFTFLDGTVTTWPRTDHEAPAWVYLPVLAEVRST